MAQKFYGTFVFRRQYLKLFTEYPETRHRIIEACDKNLILDMPFRQYIKIYAQIKSFPINSPNDIALLELQRPANSYRDFYE